MRSILLILILITNIHSITNKCLKLDLVLLVDISGSVEEREHFIADACQSFVDNLNLGENDINISIITFNSYTTTLSPLTANRNNLNKAIDNIRFTPAHGMTNMPMGLRQAAWELNNSSRQGVRKMVIIITDGMPDSRQDTLLAVDELSLFSIQLCGVFVYDYYDDTIAHGLEFLKSICGACFTHGNYVILSEQIKRLSICL